MWYRLWQVWRLQTRHLTADQRRWVQARLTPAQFALFSVQQRGDQFHAYIVAHTLHQRGYADTPLLVAALLHDCGKAPGVSLFYRTLLFILKRRAPHRLTQLRPTADGWLMPLARAWHHPELGAGLAAAVNSDPDVVTLIYYHQHRTPPLPEPLAALHRALQTVDDSH